MMRMVWRVTDPGAAIDRNRIVMGSAAQGETQGVFFRGMAGQKS